MSNFFAEGNISDSDSNAGSEDKENANRHGPSYQYDFMDEDRGNNEKRVVRTEKDKKWSLIKDITVKINSALNNQDFEKTWALLQELLKEVEKISSLIQKEGYPRLFLRCLKKIKDQIAEVDSSADAKKKMKKHSATAFNTMKQKFKKIYPQFEASIDEEAEQESEESQQIVEEESDQESDQEDNKNLLESSDPMVRRKYWLLKPKKIPNQDAEEAEEDKKKAEEKKKPNEKVEKKAIVTKKKTVVEIQSIKDAQNRMKQIRKNFMKLHNQQDREEYLLTLDKISQNSKSYKHFEQLSFYLLDIPIRIDVCRQMKLTHFPRNQLTRMYQTIIQINHLLQESEEDDLLSNIRLFDETSSKNEVPVEVSQQSIYLSLKTYLILIEGELKKALIFLAANDSQYYDRIQDLLGLIDLMYKISRRIESFEQYERDASELAFKVLENTYFMSSTLINKIKKDLNWQPQFLQLIKEEVMENYISLILKHTTIQQTRIKTLLYLIYNHAVNYREKGKEILVVSTLSETILTQDYLTQALYNRTLAQLGLSAFRNGNMFEVQQFLYQMCSVARIKQNTKDVLKQFLAQGFSRTTAEKQIPRNKILPAYLHLSVDLVESVELVSGMLLQLPYTLTEGGRITSKTFKKFYYEYERSYFIEASLNNRDLIYAAALQLKKGNWKDSFEKLQALNIWEAMPDADTALSNLQRVVKQQSLKCYLIGNRKCFKSISIEGLAKKFDLQNIAIRKTICKLINEKIIQGTITHQGYLIFAQKKQSQVQKICETLANRLQEMGKAHQLWFSQKVNAANESDDEAQHEKQQRPISRKLNLAINDKLKSILSKRTQKY